MWEIRQGRWVIVSSMVTLIYWYIIKVYIIRKRLGMKKKTKVFIITIFVVVILVSIIHVFLNMNNESFLENVEGKIYYLKRDEGILKLYKSDANLKNEELIYSHYKKGKTNYGTYNDNISDFRYYSDSGVIEFEAMHDGEWSIFRIKDGEKEPQYIKTAPEEYKTIDNYRVVSVDVNYIDLETDEFKIYEKDDSIYLERDGTEKCIKKYRGGAKSDISGLVGYVPEGLSPDSKYLIYGTTGSFTGIGALLGISKYKRYIMDLDTLESVEYINSESIQWINE